MKVNSIFLFDDTLVQYLGRTDDCCDKFKIFKIPSNKCRFARRLFKWWYEDSNVDFSWENEILILREYIPEIQKREEDTV